MNDRLKGGNVLAVLRRIFVRPSVEQAAPSPAPLPGSSDSTEQPPLSEDVVHICIVSGERMGNIIPVLHEDRPTRIILLHTTQMSARAEQMERFFRSRTIGGQPLTTTLYPLDGNSPAEIQVAMRKLRLWLNRNAAGSAWHINVTGGTTPMKLALFDAMRDAVNANASFIYSDTARDCVENLTSGTQLPYRDILNVGSYLLAQGVLPR